MHNLDVPELGIGRVLSDAELAIGVDTNAVPDGRALDYMQRARTHPWLVAVMLSQKDLLRILGSRKENLKLT